MNKHTPGPWTAVKNDHSGGTTPAGKSIEERSFTDAQARDYHTVHHTALV